MSLIGIGPSSSYIEIANGNLTVVMGWAFKLKAPLSEIESARLEDKPVSWRFGIGVHGLAGEWAVNATRRPHVVITFKSPQRGRVIGFPVKVKVLHLTPAEPERLLEELGTS
jgi:hypothetical protein